jgi:hypothetical protein
VFALEFGFISVCNLNYQEENDRNIVSEGGRQRRLHAAWIGGFVFVAGAAMIFAGFVALFIDPPLPA